MRWLIQIHHLINTKPTQFPNKNNERERERERERKNREDDHSWVLHKPRRSLFIRVFSLTCLPILPLLFGPGVTGLVLLEPTSPRRRFSSAPTWNSDFNSREIKALSVSLSFSLAQRRDHVFRELSSSDCSSAPSPRSSLPLSREGNARASTALALSLLHF